MDLKKSSLFLSTYCCTQHISHFTYISLLVKITIYLKKKSIIDGIVVTVNSCFIKMKWKKKESIHRFTNYNLPPQGSRLAVSYNKIEPFFH